MQRHVVKLSERVLGQEHPRTLGRVRALAQTLEMQGKLDEASSLFLYLLDLEKVLDLTIPGRSNGQRIVRLYLRKWRDRQFQVVISTRKKIKSTARFLRAVSFLLYVGPDHNYVHQFWRVHRPSR